LKTAHTLLIQKQEQVYLLADTLAKTESQVKIENPHY